MLTLYYISIFGFIGLCAFLCFIILIQESKSMGFGASFGGDMGSSFWGTSTPVVLKKITVYVAAALFVLCLFLSCWGENLSESVDSIPMVMEESPGDF